MSNSAMFDEMLDECYPSVTIAGIEFPASKILRECDPVAYRCTLADWEDDQGLGEDDEDEDEDEDED